jgi:hypothetical protein
VVAVIGTGTGICRVNATLSDGTKVMSSVTFDGEWLPCGDDPHGCGQRLWDSERTGRLVLGQPCSN